MINLFDHKGILFEMTGPSGEIEIKHCVLIFILKEKRDNPALIVFPYWPRILLRLGNIVEGIQSQICNKTTALQVAVICSWVFFILSAWLPCALIGHGDIPHQNNIHIYLFLVRLFWNMVLWLWCRSTYGSKDMPEVQFHLWKTSKEGFGNAEGEENQHYTTASSHGKLCMLVYHFSVKHF